MLLIMTQITKIREETGKNETESIYTSFIIINKRSAAQLEKQISAKSDLWIQRYDKVKTRAISD